MGAILSFLPTLWSILGELPKMLSAGQYLLKAITDAEATGQPGDQKLAAVLNDFESAIGILAPQWSGEFSTIAQDVEGVVNEVVAMFNLFAKAAPAKA